MRLLGRYSACVWLILIACIVSGCASLLDPRDVVLPLSRLQKSVDQKFPFHGRYADMFEVEAARPKLLLHPDANRIAAILDVRIAPTFMKRALQGQINISGVLQIDAARNAVVLTQPRLDKLAIPTASGIEPAILQENVGRIVEEVFNNMVVYTFRPEELRTTFVRWRPVTISTQSAGIVISFEPEN